MTQEDRKHDEDIERLVSRHLDGDLGPDEKLQLDKTILRDPEARRLLEESQRIDALASAALCEAVSDATPAFDPLELTCPKSQTCRPGYRRTWWLMPGAIAAGLMLLFAVRSNVTPLVTEGPMSRSGPVVTRALDEAPDVLEPGMIDLASYGPQRIKRHTDREMIGIVGEDGNVYWLEIDRVKTLKGPLPKTPKRGALGDM